MTPLRLACMSKSLSPASLSCIENLMNLVYLCDSSAQHPFLVREYMRQAQRQLERLVEAEGLGTLRDKPDGA